MRGALVVLYAMAFFGAVLGRRESLEKKQWAQGVSMLAAALFILLVAYEAVDQSLVLAALLLLLFTQL